MKILLKLNLCLLAVVAIIIVSCKPKPDSRSSSSASVASSPYTPAAAGKGNSVMDSLNITDPDEKKICALYDDAITDYLKNSKILLGDTSQAAVEQRKALDEKWKEKEQEIRPQVQEWQRKVAANPAEAMKFAQFSVYESKRLMGVMALYEKNLMKNMPTTVPKGN